MPQDTKRCCRCSEAKPHADFNKRTKSPDGLSFYCRPCARFLNKEARLVAQGLACRYYPPTSTHKACGRCRVVKPADEFYVKRGRTARNGDPVRDSWCPPCWTEYNRDRLANNPDAALRTEERIRAWQQANRERVLEFGRQYRARNPEKVAAWNAAWHEANPERSRAIRARRRAKQRAARIAKFDATQLAARMAFFGDRCWMCDGPFESVDHVKPISKGGAHILANLRPACGHCNNVKHARWYGVAELARFRMA